MNYIIKTINKEEFIITEEEFNSLKQTQNKGLLFIPSINGIINIACVSSVLTETQNKFFKKRNQTTGRLNDGQRVFKIGGIWKDAEGRIIDPQYYPEVAKDNVMSEEEWDERDKRIIKIYESNCNFSTKPRMGKRAKTDKTWQDDGRLRASK